jgi:hypothetical protein
MSLTVRPGGSVTRLETMPVDTATRSRVRLEPIHTESSGPVAEAASLKSAVTAGSVMARMRARLAGLTW